MKLTQNTSSTSLKKTLPLLGVLLFFSFLFLLSCGDLSGDHIDSSKLFRIDVFAGDGTAGSDNGQGQTAQFKQPTGIAIDADDMVYVADTGNNLIRKITSAGLVSPFVGSTRGFKEGQGDMAKLNAPRGIAIGLKGNLYVTDSGNNRIRKITSEGKVTTFAGDGTTTQFSLPLGMAIASDGTIYVVNTDNSSIQEITSGRVITTFPSSDFRFPSGVAIDADDTVYVTDTGNNLIRKIAPDGTVSIFAGGTGGFMDGQGTAAQFHSPRGIAVASDGTLYVVDSFNKSIRKITAAGKVTTIVKDLKNPSDIALSPDGSTAYIANTGNDQILKLSNLSRAGSALEMALVQSQTNPRDDTQVITSPVGGTISLSASTISISTSDTSSGISDLLDALDFNTVNLIASSNIPGGGTPIWKVADESIATVTSDGANAQLKGLAAATAGKMSTRLTVTINGLSKTVLIEVITVEPTVLPVVAPPSSL